MARCRWWQSETHLRVGVFLVKFSKFFYNFTKIHFNSLYTKQSKIFFKKFSGVVVVGVWWCCGVVFNLFSCVYTHVYLYTIYIKYLYFMHIFWCFVVFYALFMQYIHTLQHEKSPKFKVQNSVCRDLKYSTLFLI